MFSATSLRRPALKAGLAASALILASSLLPATASAQELVHRFINPSFGGNPFYSDHLLGIANIHRPDEPEEPEEPTPTEEDLLADQLRSSLNSQAVSQILERIRNAAPGQTGEFSLGGTQISFTRSTTETRVTFRNTETGESRLVVVPVQGGSGASGSAATALRASPEQSLGALGSFPSGPLSGTNSSSLLGTPPL